MTEPVEIIARYREMLSEVLRDALEDVECLTFTPERGVLAGVYFTIVHSGAECAGLLAQPTITAGGVLRGILESFCRPVRVSTVTGLRPAHACDVLRSEARTVC